jgi:hypothetical protein
VANLRFREAQRGQSRHRVRLVPQAIARLLWRAVVARSVGLDDQAEVWPVEVDPKAIHDRLHLRSRKPDCTDEPQEPQLQQGVGEARALLVQQRSQTDKPGSPGQQLDRRP